MGKGTSEAVIRILKRYLGRDVKPEGPFPDNEIPTLALLSLFMRTLPSSLALMVLAGVFVLGACSGPQTFQAQSLSQPPSIDGELSEWGGTLTRAEDSPVTMSVAPTDSMLYMAVLIPDQDLIRAVAKNGLLVWVDPSDTQAHTYGVQYPLALRSAQRSAATSAGPEGAASLDDLFPSDLAIIRNDTVRHRMPAGLSSALRVQGTLSTGSLIYEIAIPVSHSTSEGATDAQEHGILEPMGPAVAIGIETPDPEEDADRFEQSPGIPSVTGQGGRRGRSPRGRRGRRGRQGGQQRQQPSPTPDTPRLDLWTRVVTAEQ